MNKGVLKRIISILFLLPVLVFAQKQKTPALPYVQKDKLPGEGLQLGAWKAKDSLKAYGTEDKKAVLFILKPGEKFTALKGNVHVLKPGMVLVTEDFDDFKKGEKISVLSYSGEGFYDVWHHGKVYDYLPDLWSPQNGEKTKGILKTKPVTEWWVMVKTKDGKKGWLFFDGKRETGKLVSGYSRYE